jgi:hypothetical protein
MWHATWEADESELRRIDPQSGEVLERLAMPEGVGISGLESDGAGLFYCGGGNSGKVRVVRRPSSGGTSPKPPRHPPKRRSQCPSQNRPRPRLSTVF